MKYSLRILFAVAVLLTLANCGGGGAAPPAPTNNWDQMKWDVGKWL